MAYTNSCEINLLPPATPIVFSGIIVGRTGSGKSTFIDVLGNGIELAQVGAVDGDSETEKTCVYQLPALRDEWRDTKGYKIIDTPGFDDTGGHDVSNQAQVQSRLREIGAADGVILVFKVNEKYTEDVMSAFLFIRSYFGPSIWKRMILVYTFFTWQEDCFDGRCMTCRTMADLQVEHEKVMAAAFNYTVSLGTGDVRCDDVQDTRCFPDAEKIPFIGSDLYLQKLEKYRRYGLDLFNPQDRYYKQCPDNSSNAAKQLARFHDIVKNITQAPGFQPMELTDLTNTWIQCKKARHSIGIMRRGVRSAIVVNSAASHLHRCFKGQIKSEITKIRDELIGNRRLQAQLAFSLSGADFVTEANGFDKFNVNDLDRYPDYKTYDHCRTASILIPPSIPSVDQDRCWQGLITASHPPRDVKIAIEELLRAVQCRCTTPGQATPNNRFSCSLPRKDWSCDDNAACTHARNWDLIALNSSDVCQEVPKCSSSVCVAEFEVLKTQLPRQCAGMSCSRAECCMRAGMCTHFDCGHGRVQTSNAPEFCSDDACTNEECCEPAPTCTSDVCFSPMEILKSELPQFCMGGACTREQCCTGAEMCSDYVCEDGWISKRNRPTFCVATGCTHDQCCHEAQSCDNSVCDVDDYKLKSDLPLFCAEYTCALDECCEMRPTCQHYQCADGYKPKSSGICYGRTCHESDCCYDACDEMAEYVGGVCFDKFWTDDDGSQHEESYDCSHQHCFKQKLYEQSPRCYATWTFHDGNCRTEQLDMMRSAYTGRVKKILVLGFIPGALLAASASLRFWWRLATSSYGQPLLRDATESYLAM